MLKKSSILERTNSGLDVFRHYITCDWRVGRNFHNPLYKDTKASCNIYFDRRSGIYRMKDFGNAEYSGDCFFLVAVLNGLDCTRSEDFVQIMEIIVRDMSLNISIPVPEVKKQVPISREQKAILGFSTVEQPFSIKELDYWLQYGITTEVLNRYRVVSLKEFKSENKEGKPYAIQSSEQEPIFGYAGKKHIKIYRPFSELRFLYGGDLGDNYCFGLEQLPSKGDTVYITGGEKDVMTLAAHV